MGDKFKKVALVVALIVAGMFAAPTQPAAAASTDCYAQTICLFAHANFGNPIWRQTAEQVPGCTTLYGFNDVTSHVWNRISGAVFTFYWDAGCTGASFNLASGTYSNLGPTAWNDKISSMYMTLT